MTVTEAREMMIEMIATETIYHQDKERTEYVADWCKAMMTGHDQNEVLSHKSDSEGLLTVYRPNETEIEKDQLLRLYNPLTGVAGNGIKSIYDKVSRTDGIEAQIEISDDSRLEQITNDLSDFYSEDSLKDWIFDKLCYITFFDPNSFLIIEKDMLEDASGAVSGINTYPTVFHAHEVANFEYKYGKLDWFLGEQLRWETVDGVEHQLSTFYFYHKNIALEFKEVHEDNAQAAEAITISDSEQVRYFEITEYFDTGSPEIPVIQLGIYRDPMTGGRTFISPLHYAEHVLNDLIRDKAFQDLRKVLHIFMQKYVYVADCDYEDPDLGRCIGGKVTFERNGREETHSCPKCKGEGRYLPTTEQGAVALKLNLPATADDQFIPLSDLVHYVPLDLSVPQWFTEEIDKAMSRVHQAVFTTETFSNSEIQTAETATAKMLDVEQVANRLNPFANHISRVYAKVVRVSASYWGTIAENAGLYIPQDLNIESVPQLIAKYGSAKTNGLGSAVLDGIQHHILQKQYRNNPGKLQKINAYEMHKPFRSQPPELVAMILGERDKEDIDKVLYENWDRAKAMTEIATNENFAQMEYPAQRQALEAVAQELINQIKYNQPAPVALPFGSVDEEE